MWNKKNISEIFATLLVFLFLYTGLSKYTSFHRFQAALSQSPILKHYSGIISFLIPGIEILIAISLIVPKTRKIGFLFSFFLLTLFTLYLVYMITFTPNLPCTCGGVITQLTWKQHIFFNLTFIAISYAGARLNRLILLSSDKKHQLT